MPSLLRTAPRSVSEGSCLPPCMASVSVRHTATSFLPFLPFPGTSRQGGRWGEGQADLQNEPQAPVLPSAPVFLGYTVLSMRTGAPSAEVHFFRTHFCTHSPLKCISLPGTVPLLGAFTVSSCWPWRETAIAHSARVLARLSEMRKIWFCKSRLKKQLYILNMSSLCSPLKGTVVEQYGWSIPGSSHALPPKGVLLLSVQLAQGCCGRLRAVGTMSTLGFLLLP